MFPFYEYSAIKCTVLILCEQVWVSDTCFSSNEIRLLFFSRSSSFSVIHVSVVVLNTTSDTGLYAGAGRTYRRTGGHVITKFSRIKR